MQFSHFLVSLSMILMSANYLIEGKYLQKAKFVWKNYTILLFIGLFAIHLIGLLWSTDTHFGIHDIQIKLPLFALPLAIGSTQKLSAKKFEWVLLFFIATSLLSSLIGSLIYFFLSAPGDDHRLMSPFLSHIRLSLMIGVAIFACFYLRQRTIQWSKYKHIFTALCIWFVYYLFILRSMSGLFAFFSAIFILVWLTSEKQKSRLTKTIRLVLISFLLLTSGYIYWQINLFYSLDKIDSNTVEKQSKSGENYEFDFDSKQIENGHFVQTYIAPNELESTWNQISKYPFDSLDLKGHSIKSTITRYLTSKNLRKDKEGVLALNEQDIWAIENGIANVRYLNNKSINTLIYRYTWGIYNFNNGGNPEGNSLAQRFLFWRIGSQILSQNLLYGVGTGDVQLAFDSMYTTLPYVIQKKYQLRAHNQYLTMGITFGILGLLYFVWMFFSIFKTHPNSKSYLFIGTFIILMTSMLDEDTLETQFGITYALFFFFLFIYHQPLSTEENNGKQTIT